jgi:hypothetical protein
MYRAVHPRTPRKARCSVRDVTYRTTEVCLGILFYNLVARPPIWLGSRCSGPCRSGFRSTLTRLLGEGTAIATLSAQSARWADQIRHYLRWSVSGSEDQRETWGQITKQVEEI